MWRILEESATVACHCVWVLCIDHLPFTADVFDASGGHPKHSISMTSANAVYIKPCYDSIIHFVKYNALIVSQFQAIRHIENSSHAKIKVFDMLQAKVSCYTVDITIW